MSYTNEPATDAEIIADKAWHISRGQKVMFRHFVVEVYNARSARGVSHRQYGHSTLRVIDGAPFVMHHGKLERITAEVIVNSETGRRIVVGLKLASKYLP